MSAHKRNVRKGEKENEKQKEDGKLELLLHRLGFRYSTASVGCASASDI